MNRIVTTTAICLSAWLTTSASADHYGDLRRAYTAQKTEFTQAYHAQRRELRHAVERTRRALLDERQLISRIDCHETRARRLRVNSRELSELARDHSRQNRELSRAFHDGLRALRDNYEYTRAQIRAGRPPVLVESHAHPANCTCEMCAPPTQIRRYVDAHDPYHHPHQNRRRYARKPNGLDIAVAILSMLN